MDIKLRKAKTIDANDIVTINIKSWKDTYNNVFPAEFLNSLENLKDETIRKCVSKIDEYAVILEKEKVIWFTRFGLNKKGYNNEYAEIYSLYIDSSYRNKHFGRNILEFSFDCLRSKYKYCLISTLVENRANDFYLKNGGKLVGKVNFKLLDKEYVENLYLFEL